MRTGEAAISWGRNQITNPTQSWERLCLKFVRSCYGIPAKYADAGKAWDNAKHKHPTRDPMSIPRGVPVFFETPGTADHIVLSLGNGLCLTNDWSAPGKISVARIADIAARWGQLLGWTEDLNGVPVYSPPATPVPEKPAAAEPGPTLLDITVALARLAEQSKNPDAARRYLLARMVLADVVGTNRVRVPTTVAGIRDLLKAKEADASVPEDTKVRIRSVLPLLHGI